MCLTFLANSHAFCQLSSDSIMAAPKPAPFGMEWMSPGGHLGRMPSSRTSLGSSFPPKLPVRTTLSRSLPDLPALSSRISAAALTAPFAFCSSRMSVWVRYNSSIRLILFISSTVSILILPENSWEILPELSITPASTSDFTDEIRPEPVRPFGARSPIVEKFNFSLSQTVRVTAPGSAPHAARNIHTFKSRACRCTCRENISFGYKHNFAVCAQIKNERSFVFPFSPKIKKARQRV